MGQVTAGQLLAQALAAEGVDTFFHLQERERLVYDLTTAGLRAVLVRNELAGGMMAHAYSRVAGKPGVVLTAPGPGTANLVPAMANALADACPVIALGASAHLLDRHTGTFQEMDQVRLMEPVTKWAAQLTHPHRIAEYVSSAFRHALAAPQGPVYLDLPADVVEQGPPIDEEQAKRPTKYRTQARPHADPALVEQAIELLALAQKPLVVAGSGVLWSGASSELQGFVDLTGTPFFTTPQARGVIPEDHPLFFGGARSMAFREADVVLVVGTRANIISTFFLPPRWNPDVKIIAVNLDPTEIGKNAPVEVGLYGDAQAVLRQLTDAARGRFEPRRSEWVSALAKRDASRSEREAQHLNSDQTPIHPLRLCREVGAFMDRDAILALDGNETLVYGNQSILTFMPGHRLTPGPHGTMGVGVPFGIGAQLAKPDKQVVVLTGDGAFGWYGIEVDTAVRYQLPVLFVICNNGGYAAAFEGIDNPQRELGFTRYDRMVEALGGHGEFVERPEAIRPALERAYASGKPAAVNVITDPYASASTAAFFTRPDRQGVGDVGWYL